MIELTENARSAPAARYRARLLATKPGSDLALLGIYWDEVARRPLDDTAAVSLPALPIADAGTIALGERLHILGYPLAGGTAMNYTPAALGGFDENGAMLKANVSLNEGYSGGPALVERDGQYEIAGVVVLRRADVSYIRSVDQLGGMIWQPGRARVGRQRATYAEARALTKPCGSVPTYTRWTMPAVKAACWRMHSIRRGARRGHPQMGRWSRGPVAILEGAERPARAAPGLRCGSACRNGAHG